MFPGLLLLLEPHLSLRKREWYWHYIRVAPLPVHLTMITSKSVPDLERKKRSSGQWGYLPSPWGSDNPGPKKRYVNLFHPGKGPARNWWSCQCSGLQGRAQDNQGNEHFFCTWNLCFESLPLSCSQSLAPFLGNVAIGRVTLWCLSFRGTCSGPQRHFPARHHLLDSTQRVGLLGRTEGICHWLNLGAIWTWHVHLANDCIRSQFT